jgi:ribonuclease HI
MPATEFTCDACGNSFSLAPSVLAKYPNWTPKTCMACRPKAAAKGAKPAAKGGRGASVTRTSNLTTTEVLLRFSAGPTDGIFTDGSCQGNPGPGGWGAVFVRDGKVAEQRWGSDPATTNNRMELTAMIEGLSMAGPRDSVDVYSDSMLVVNTLTKWAAGWAARGWKRKEGEVANLDLVQRAYALMQERPNARVQWIRAHDGSRWNEYADSLSQAYLRDEV